MKTATRPPLFLAAVLTTLVFATSGICGLVMTEADGTRSLVSDGRIKSTSDDPEEEQMIIDLKNSRIIILDAQAKTAAKASMDEFCAQMKKISASMAEAMEQMKAQGLSEMPPGMGGGPSAVRVEKAGDGGKIAGYSTVKYKIYADGELYEEAWFSKDKKLTREMGDPDKMARFEKCASQMMGANSVEASDEYQKMNRAAGWLLKSVEHGGGDTETIVDVRQIEKTDIPDSEFEVPPGYEEFPFKTLFQ